MQVIETKRLAIRHLAVDDGEFILGLLNEPSFLANIGDRHVRTVADAELYLQAGPLASYREFGFGLFLVLLRERRIPIGICGLLKRETLQDPDIGFAFREEFWGCGYAFESAVAVMNYGRTALRLRRIVAITKPENRGSIRILEKIGMRFEKRVTLPGSEAAGNLYAIEFKEN